MDWNPNHFVGRCVGRRQDSGYGVDIRVLLFGIVGQAVERMKGVPDLQAEARGRETADDGFLCLWVEDLAPALDREFCPRLVFNLGKKLRYRANDPITPKVVADRDG